jgi:hypothetical protein
VDEFVQYKMQLPKDLREKLTELGEAADRSLSAEIVWRLSQSLAPEWQAFIAMVGERERREQSLLERLRQNPEAMEQVTEVLRKLEDGTTIGDHMKKQGGTTEEDAPKPPSPTGIRRPLGLGRKP